MIVPMQQVTLATARRERAATLQALQGLGIVHLAATGAATADAVSASRARLDSARNAIQRLDAASATAARGATGPTAAGGPLEGERSAQDVIGEIERLASRVEDLKHTRHELERQRQRLEPFGAFDPAEVRRLFEHGIGVRLARPPSGRPPPPVEGAAWVELARDRRAVALALVGARGAVDAAEVPDEVPLPSESPSRLSEELEAVDRALLATRERLAALGRLRSDVERWVRRCEDEVRFEEARAAMEDLGAVSVLRGYVPVDELPRLRDLALERGWGVWIADVEDDEAAPTLIRNPRWVRPIEPVFSFLGVVPGYGQVDISVPFLIFFGLFFAMIVGDAGYGAVFLALTEVVRRRLPGASPRVVTLMRVLSVGTIVWGLASGNVFGAAALPSALLALRLEWLTDERNVMALAFTIGVVHLTVAHAWNVVRFINGQRALVEVGWIATTWTMYFLARQLVLGEPFPPFAWGLLVAGVTLIALFITPWRKLRQEWFTHAMLPLNLVGNFVDVVSYVRLFAVGAATFAVAESFNELAASIGLDGVLGGLVTALVLFLGHTLNVLLAAMGVLVHGVRLNTLEFASHLGLSWTGHPYRPFARSAPADLEGEPS